MASDISTKITHRGESYTELDWLAASVASCALIEAEEGAPAENKSSEHNDSSEDDDYSSAHTGDIYNLRTSSNPNGPTAVVGHDNITFYPANYQPRPPKLPEISTPVRALSRPVQQRATGSLATGMVPSTPTCSPSRPVHPRVAQSPAISPPAVPPSTPIHAPSPPVQQRATETPVASHSRSGSVSIRLDATHFPPRNPNHPTRIANIPGRSRNRWYACIVGRRTDVFDDWYVNLSKCILVFNNPSL